LTSILFSFFVRTGKNAPGKKRAEQSEGYGVWIYSTGSKAALTALISTPSWEFFY
jgi:hypothetical protein